jgi:hypothetical protein
MVLFSYTRCCGEIADEERNDMEKDARTKRTKETTRKKASVHKVKDNSLKAILADHGLFAEFLKDFVSIDTLRGVESEDVEDVTERFTPLFDENRDSDTVKRIKLKNGSPLFVVALVEHESKVNFRSCFKMLQYIVLILGDCEKEANEKKRGIVNTKEFKYPPVLPIVFYDGKSPWTAARTMLDRTELSEAFGKYIPKFEYELVSLNEYTEQDLVNFGGALSLIMLLDKMQNPEDLSILKKLPEDYAETLSKSIPPRLSKLLSDVATALLRRINVPPEEIAAIADKIYERRIQEMFTGIKGYDVQETRRLARNEGILEGKRYGILEGERKGILKGKREGILEGERKGKREGERASKIEIAHRLKLKGMDDAEIAEITTLSPEDVATV